VTWNQTGPLVADLTWDQVKIRLARGALAILPIGAGAKQHGLHLPMNTDQIVAEHLAHALASRLDALIWPTLSYGFYPAFTAYAGSVSLTSQTFKATVGEIIDGLLGFGAARVLVLDTGLSTNWPVGKAISECANGSQVRHIKVFSGQRFLEAAEVLREQTLGSHADELETSLMLAIAPERVDMTRASASPISAGGPVPGPLTPDDPTSLNYSPSGSLGDPTLASREKGLILLRAILDDLQEGAS
jgi:creatinine amidohydrolase